MCCVSPVLQTQHWGAAETQQKGVGKGDEDHEQHGQSLSGLQIGLSPLLC